jgi:hypothetical protein
MSARAYLRATQSQWFVPCLTFLFGYVVLFLRRPETLLAPGFVFEDGRDWYLDAWTVGPGAVLRPYAGYLDLVPRLVAVVERSVPVPDAPLFGAAIALAITAAVAAFVASDALSGVIPSQLMRLGLAGCVIVAPLTSMTLGSVTFAQFWLALFVIAAAFSSGGMFVKTALFATGLSGPFAILMTPLYAMRLWVKRDRESWQLLIVIASAGIIQLAVLAMSGRHGAAPTMDPLTVVRILGIHLNGMVLGERWMGVLNAASPTPWLGVLGSAGFAVLVALVLRGEQRVAVVGLGGSAILIVASALLLGTDDASLLLDPLSATRYFMVPAVILLAFTLRGIARHDRAAMILGCFVVIGVAGDFRLPTYPDLGWPSASWCIGGPAPCVVPIYPGGQWDIEWPGMTN